MTEPTPYEWEVLSRKVFPKRLIQAPPFLWTRILATIENIEKKQAKTWWAQWRWMGRVTVAAAVAVSLGMGILIYQSGGVPLETLLRGNNASGQVLRLSKQQAPTTEEVTAWILGGKPWEDD